MVHPPTETPTPTWSIGDRVVFKRMYGTGCHVTPIVYEVRGVDGAAVWLKHPSGPGHITAGADWVVPAPAESTT